MILGNAMLRPQSFARRTVDAEHAVTNDFIELISRLTQDVLGDGSARAKIESVVAGRVTELVDDIEAALDEAADDIEAWFEPMVASIRERAEQVGDVGDAGDLVNSLAGILDLLSSAVQAMSSEEIADKLNQLGDIVEEGIGLTHGRLGDLVTQCAEEVVDVLTASYLGGDRGPDARNEFLIGTSLSRLLDYGRGFGDELSFDRRSAVDELAATVKGKGWDERLAGIDDTLTGTGDGLSRLSSFFSGGEADTESARAGSAPDPKSWYATWFLGETTAVADRFRLEDEPFADRIRFSSGLSPEFMEQWAHLSAGIGDLAEAALHAASIERGDIASNIVNLSLQAVKGIVVLATYDHDSEEWVDALDVIESGWFEYLLLAGAGTTLASMEGAVFEFDKHRFIYWATLLGADVVEMLLYANWTYLARESSLSLLTLINSDLDEAPRAENHDKVEGLALLFAEAGSWIAASLSGRKRYGFPLSDGVAFFILFWALGIVIGPLMAMIGWLFGGALAGKRGEDFGWVWKSILLSAFKWPVYWYLLWDGDTDRGKLGLDERLRSVTFNGYPGRESSPYRLPFRQGETLPCVQGNQGVWSHNVGTGQIYAVDFGHDHGTAVPASRGGTVVHYFDELYDHIEGGFGNSITIRHNDPAEPVLPDPVHDRDHRPQPVQTFMTYYHAKHYGVRDAFATRGIPPNRIVGSPVEPGTVIMFSGDTGISAYNHLHTYVHTDVPVPDTTSPVTSFAGASAPTIPFVYRETGVPRAQDYYVSDNPAAGELAPIALYQPARQRSHIGRANVVSGTRNRRTRGSAAGHVVLDRQAMNEKGFYEGCFVHIVGTRAERLISAYDGKSRRATVDPPWTVAPAPGSDYEIRCRTRASGADFVVLDPRADRRSDSYEGAHIYVWFTDGSGNEIVQYETITAYDDKTQRVTIAGSFEPPPPAGSEYMIGAPPYASARAFDKTFGYWAPVDATNAAQPFPDGRPPYEYARIAKYHGASASGVIRTGGAAGTSSIELELTASAVNDDYNGRHIMIMRAGHVLQYKTITDYVGASRRVIISGTWDTGLVAGAGGDRYLVGAPPYARATDDDKLSAYWGPDDPVGTYAPIAFPDGVDPYGYGPG